jgi:hypothetical protein
MEMAVYEWLPMQEPDFYHKVIVKFVTIGGIYISVVFDYFGKSWYTSVMIKLRLTVHITTAELATHRSLPMVASTATNAFLAVRHMTMTSHRLYLHHPCCCSYCA